MADDEFLWVSLSNLCVIFLSVVFIFAILHLLINKTFLDSHFTNPKHLCVFQYTNNKYFYLLIIQSWKITNVEHIKTDIFIHCVSIVCKFTNLPSVTVVQSILFLYHRYWYRLLTLRGTLCCELKQTARLPKAPRRHKRHKKKKKQT